jgi:NADH-quinone oxidoreductase subunit N
MYANYPSDLIATLPITIVALVGIFVVLYDAYRHNAPELPWIAFGGLAVAAVVSFLQLGETSSAFNGHFLAGGFAAYVKVVILFGAAGSVLLSQPYLRRIGRDYGEVYALMLFATVGMMVLGSSGSVITMFVGLETMAISFAVLTGLVRDDIRANESALKLFLLSAFASAFFLYGIVMLFGASGTVFLAEMPAALAEIAGEPEQVFVYVGVGLMMVGFFFKVSAVPFHMWTPDVYQGAPTSITAYISTTAKVAAFAALILVLWLALGGEQLAVRWEILLAVIAAITMVVGNVVALSQTNIKRLLAYSWIAHSGYVMTGLAAGSTAGFSAAMYYLLAYTLMNLGAFGVIGALEWDEEQGATQTIDSLAGIGYRKPILGVTMGIFMFALIGFPPLAGFIGKYLVFVAAIEGGLLWLALIGVLTSIVSAYYYLRVLVAFWMKDPADQSQQVRQAAFPVSPVTKVVLIVCAVGLLVFGIVPGGVMELTEALFVDPAAVTPLR